MASQKNFGGPIIPAPIAFQKSLVFIVIFLILVIGGLNFYLYQGSKTAMDSGELGKTKQSNFICPVEKKLCLAGKNILYEGNQAIGFSLPSGTSFKSIAPVVDWMRRGIMENGVELGQLVRQTTIIDSCYTVTYTLAKDAQVAKFDLMPLDRGTILGSVGGAMLEVGGQKFNLILQIQKRALSGSVSDSDFKRCGVANVAQVKIGEYQSIDLNTFE